MSAQPDDVKGENGEGYQKYNREYLLPTQAEPPAVINAREIENWCSRCKQYKMSILSDETSAGICFGVAAGFAAAWWAGDFTDHPDRAFALKLGIAFALGLFLLFLGRTILTRRKTEHDLGMLSNEMATAKEAGLGRARAAIAAESASDKAKPPQQSSG